MKRRMVLGAALALSLPSTVAPAKTIVQPTHYIVRHFDTPAGERDPDLTATGKARAEALARRFAKGDLVVIYVTSFKRTQQTVAPLAAAQGLTPIVYGPAPTPEFIAALRSRHGGILVVGHSNTAPDIVAGVGGERPGPIAHPDFGDMWTVTRGQTTRERIDP